MKPLGLLTIGEALRKNGYQISLIDCLDRNQPDIPRFKLDHTRSNGTGHYFREIIPKPDILKHIPRNLGRYGLPLNLVKAKLKNIHPDLILMTSGMTYWYPGVVDMICLLRELYGSTPIVLGGIYATLCSDHAKKVSGADYVVSGPGVVSIQLADQITGNESNLKIENRHWPAFDLYDKLDYVVLNTSTGCPYRCPFCASHLLSEGFHQREGDDVIQEIQHWHRTKQVGHIAFYDDALLWKFEKHLVPILEKLVNQKMGIQFHTPNGMHPKYIDSDLAQLMFDAGFRTLRLSYESRNPGRQQEMGGKVSDADLEQAVHRLKKVGFDSTMISSYVLMGLPGQTFGEIVDSLLYVLGLGIPVSLASFSPIPGTQSWQESIDRGDFEVDIDPLLTNNSIFPLCKNPVAYSLLSQIRRSTNEANLAIKNGENPLKNSNIMNPLQNILKNYSHETID